MASAEGPDSVTHLLREASKAKAAEEGERGAEAEQQQSRHSEQRLLPPHVPTLLQQDDHGLLCTHLHVFVCAAHLH